MRRPHHILLALILSGCGPVAGDSSCLPDAGCFCAPTSADIDACHGIDLAWEPYCCTDHGGAIVQCGQPAGCVPKPGIEDAGAIGANWCCPAP